MEMSWESLLTLFILATASSILGVFLVLMRLGFLSAGIAHSALGAVAVATVTGVDSFLFTALYGVLLGNVILLVSKKGKFSGDLVTALFFTSGVAVGIVLLGTSESGMEHLSEAVFGQPFTASLKEVISSSALLLATLLFVLKGYRSLTLTLLNPDLARSYGVRAQALSHLLVTLSSVITVLAMKMVGILLASSLFIIPAMASLLVVSGLKRSIFVSVAIGFLSAGSGGVLNYWLNVDIGGTTVLTMLALFLSFLGLKFLRERYQ